MDDLITSSTAAITDTGSNAAQIFFGVVPTIIVYVVAIVVTLWGIRWIISQFRGGRRG